LVSCDWGRLVLHSKIKTYSLEKSNLTFQNIASQMNHQIAMYFRHAVLDSPRHDEIEARSIDWGCSIEFAILEDFDWLFIRTLKVHEDNSTFNLLFAIVTNRRVQAPSVEVKYGKDNTSSISTLLFADDFLIDNDSEKEIKITDEMLNQLGLEIEGCYGYEFIDFKRLAPNEH
jgi:hypothetical protein